MFAELFALNQKTKRNISAVLLVALIIFASTPALSSIPSGHDLTFHLYRILGLAQGLQDGVFPVRMQYSQMQGMGYPVSIMYGDLFLYIPAVLYNIGLSLTASYRVFVILLNIFVVLTTYILTKRFSNSRIIAFTITIVWTLGTYRLVDIYLRGAIGEYLALAAFPFIVYGLWCAFSKRGRNTTKISPSLWIAFGMIGIVLSHAISSILAFFAFVFLFLALAIFGDNKKQGWICSIGSFGITIAICLWFIVPFLSWYMGQDMWVKTAESTKDLNVVSSFSGTLGQLLEIFPTFNGPTYPNTTGAFHEMPLALGIGGLLLCMCAFISLAIDKKTMDNTKGSSSSTNKLLNFSIHSQKYLFVLFITLAICIALCCCHFLWQEQIPFMKTLGTIQFPWRFLAPILTVSVLIGLIALMRLDKVQNLGSLVRILCVGICLLTLIEAGHSMSSNMYEVKSQSDIGYSEYDEIIRDGKACGVSNGEYLPAYIPSRYYIEEYMINRVDNNELGFEFSHHGDNGRVFDASFDGTFNSTTAELPLIYYDGYEIVDSTSSSVAISKSDSGFVQLNIPQGYIGTVSLKWEEPSWWHITEVISVISLIGVLIWIGLQLRGNKQTSNNFQNAKAQHINA